MKKRLIILGSTGSIGTKTLDVVSDFPDRFEVVGLATNSKVDLLSEQVQRFRPSAVCVTAPQGEQAGRAMAEAADAQFFPGEQGLIDLIRTCDADLIMVATVGFVGTLPTIEAIRRGMTIALANKEVLVTAGDIVMEEARKAGVEILPVDSEHNAVFQCLGGSKAQSIRRLILTASGGPFRGMQQHQMQNITAADALKHPTWTMGAKITIDSSTLMNKGFEVMEAAHLFNIPVDQVDVVVHPQSTIHSMVEYLDGSVIAQMGMTDMYFPIQNILLYPERLPNRFPPLNLALLGQMTFFDPDRENFPCLDYAYQAARTGGTMPAVLNAANEVAVAAFLAGDARFLQIPETIRAAMEAHACIATPDLDQICEADRWTREFAHAHIHKNK